MILALISDISEFFQVNHTFYKLDMKPWLLVTKLGGWVSLSGSIFFMSCISVSTRALIVLLLMKEAPEMSLKINTVFNF